jgi:hypothetical protein
MTTTTAELPRHPGRSVSEIARTLPSCRAAGISTHPATLCRWITHGVRLCDGSRLKLPAVKSPGGWLVTPEDLDTFLDALTKDRLGEPAPTPPSATAARQRELDRVSHELAAAGFGPGRRSDTERPRPDVQTTKRRGRPRKQVATAGQDS